MRHFLLITIALLACNGRKSATAPVTSSAPAATHFGSVRDPLFFSLERTPCFGKCPAYTVTINADGSAKYVGRDFAPHEGTFTGHVEKVTMQRLLDRAKAIGFFGMMDSYDGEVTDLPSTIIRVSAAGKDKKVFGRYKTPPAFKPFAAYADSLLSPVKWERVAGDH